MPSTKTQLTSNEALAMAYGDNPLLHVLGEFIEIGNMPSVLARYPLSDILWERVPVGQRCDLLGLMRSHFVATPDAIEIAFAIQQMIRTGYIERNPLLLCNRQRRMQIADIADTELRTAPWFPSMAIGMVISGITGLGKTFMSSRAIDIFPQTSVLGQNKTAGWERQIQIVHIKVSMSADASRLGFLDNILLTIDKALASCGAPLESYYRIYGGKNTRMSTEKLMVRIGQILSEFYCGILIIEELQLRNFSESQELIYLFILRLLNFGIPVLLIGNPDAFDGLNSYAQDQRRIYKGKNFDLWPAQIGNDDNWKIYVAGKMKFSLLPINFNPNDKEFLAKTISWSGGVRDYFDTLWNIVQESGLRKKGKTTIEINDFEIAFQNPTMKKYHSLISALTAHKIDELAKFVDMPIEKFKVIWGMSVDNTTPRSNSVDQTKSKKSTLTPQKSRTVRKKEADTIFRARSKRATKAQQAAKEQVSPDPSAAAKRRKANLLYESMKNLKVKKD